SEHDLWAGVVRRDAVATLLLDRPSRIARRHTCSRKRGSDNRQRCSGNDEHTNAGHAPLIAEASPGGSRSLRDAHESPRRRKAVRAGATAPRTTLCAEAYEGSRLWASGAVPLP